MSSEWEQAFRIAWALTVYWAGISVILTTAYLLLAWWLDHDEDEKRSREQDKKALEYMNSIRRRK